MAAYNCQICLGIDYELFQKIGNVFVTELGDPTLIDRHHGRTLVLQFADLEEAAQTGCSICSIISQGIKLVWGNQPERFYQPVTSTSEEVTHEDDKDDLRPKVSPRPSSADPSSEFGVQRQ